MKTKDVCIKTTKAFIVETSDLLEELKKEINTMINEIELQKVLHKGDSAFFNVFRLQDLLARAVRFSAVAGKLASLCAQDHEERLEKFEQELAELKNRFPVGDGK